MNSRAFVVLLVLSASCLAAALEKSPKVVNGTDSDISRHPYMVSIRKIEAHHCGGTILNPEWVLSAAHCLHNAAGIYTVQYGTTVISGDGPTVVNVSQVIRHEDYDPDNNYKNDIGLVRLSEPIQVGFEGFMVRLPFSGTYFATGTPAVLAGWGLNATGGVLMPHLQEARLQVYSNFDCAQLHRTTVHYTNICGGIPDGGKGQCSGDSGGPLLVDGVQVGIVSWSVSTSKSSRPSTKH